MSFSRPSPDYQVDKFVKLFMSLFRIYSRSDQLLVIDG